MNVTSANLPDSYHYSIHNLTLMIPPCCDWNAAGENLFLYMTVTTPTAHLRLIFVIMYIVQTASQHSRIGKRSKKAFVFCKYAITSVLPVPSRFNQLVHLAKQFPSCLTAFRIQTAIC